MKKVLVIDDDADIFYVVQAILLNCCSEAFIAKPFNIDELSGRLSQMLERSTAAA